MYHQNVTRSGFFFTRGTAICITVLIAMMVMAFVPMGQNTADAAVGDVVMVSGGGEANSRASNMTPDGRYVAIQSGATVPGIATGGLYQILRKDLTGGDVVLASSTAAGVQADDECGHPSITPDARYVAFHSDATNLGGTGAYRQVFRKDLTNGAIVLVSSDAGGTEGDDESRRPRMSADGRYVAFESWATNLGGTGANRQTFVKDLTTGAIVMASSDATWAESNRETGHPYITPDGRYVTFHSPASNLVLAASGWDTQVFRKDLTTGAIVLASSDGAGVEADDKSKYSFITPDGRYVSFYSYATNLDVAATGSYMQVFRKDLTTGAVVLASSDAAGVEGNDYCSENGANFMTDDGQYVCFISEATNLDPAATSGDDQVFRKDLTTGAVTLVSKDSAGVEADDWTWRASMTPDGRYAAFYTEATNLGPATTGLSEQVFRKDITTGDVAQVSSSAATVGGDSDSESSSITPDGRYVAFESSATNIIPLTQSSQIWRKDLKAGQYMLVSTDASGVESNDSSEDPTITPDARYVAFKSEATNLDPAATSGDWQVFRKDLTTGAVVLASSDAAGAEGNDDSETYYPSISADGRYVTFISVATNLVTPATTPGRVNVFRKDLNTGEVKLVSSDASGAEGDSDSEEASINSDGRYVSFESQAANLGPATTPGRWNVFRKDLTTGKVKLVSSDVSGTEGNVDSDDPSTSSDGRYVSFESYATNLGPAASGTDDQVYRKDLTTGEVKLVSSDASGAESNGDNDSYRCSISPDGRYVSFYSDATNLDPAATSGDDQVYRKDLSDGAVVLASSDASGAESNDDSRQCCMTPDGRYMTFYSDATNLDPAVTGWVDQVFRKELPAPDISDVTKAVQSDDPAPGGVLTYTITITNSGQEDAIVTLTDDIPDNTSVVTGSVTCSDGGASVDSEDPVKVTNITVKAGKTSTVTFQVTIDNDVQPGTVIENQASVGFAGMQLPSSPPSDPGSGNPTGITITGKPLGSQAWIVAEGSTGEGFDTFILMQNPNNVPAPTAVAFATEDGIQDGTLLEIPPNSRTTLRLSEYMPDQWSISTLVAAEVPIVVERSMYWNSEATAYPYEMMSGHANLGLPAPMEPGFKMDASQDRSTNQYFPEGSTAGFDTWILLFNPMEEEAQAKVTLMDETGPVVEEDVTIGPLSRKTVHLNKLLPDANQVATTVESDTFLVAERSMYWDPAASAMQPYEMIGGHSTSGSPWAANGWFIAEGSTGGGFETYILVQNPSDTEAPVTLTFMDATGVVNQATTTMPAQSRSTFKVADYVPDNFQVSTSVTSDVPVVAERSMYWDNRETTEPSSMKDGHSTVGETGAAKTWMVAEGSTGGGFDTFVLITNTENTEADVAVVFMTEAGPQVPFNITIPATSRYTLRVSGINAGPG